MIAAGAVERAKRAGVCLLVVSGLAAICAPLAPAAPADLDRSFGGDGIVGVEGIPGALFSHESSARMAIGPQDEIFVLYSNPEPCRSNFGECRIDLSVARYDRNGVRDASYGVGAGSQLVVRQDPLAYEFELAVGPDGKPVVAAADDSVVAVARFDGAGHLDGTFGLGGKAPQTLEAGLGMRPPAIAVQGDGKVLVSAERGRDASSSDLLLARYLPDGQRDPSFDGDGEAVLTMSRRSRPAGILIGGDGRVSVANPQCCGGSPLFGGGFGFVRFLPDGQLDPSLAGSGQVVFPTPGTEATVEAAALAPDGGLITVFEETTSERSTVGNMIKFLPDGGIDSAFGGGRIQIAARVGAVDPSGIAVDAKGRIVGIGWDGELAAFRLRADGGIDRTFNGGQHVSLPFGGNQEAPLAVDLQSTGRIVALGETSCCGPKAFALVGLRGGTDHTRCLRHKATIVGTSKADELTGTPRRDVIAALGGKDTVRGLSGQDLICGGKGRDRLLGGAGRDEVRQ